MRVLIYSVSAGAGHVRAAEAVQAAFGRRYPKAEVRHLDVMKLVPTAFKKAYAESYIKMINALPSVWGWLYKKSDQVPQTSALITVRKFMQRLNTKDIVADAVKFKPDVILATHFLPAEIFSDLAKKPKKSPFNGARPKLAVVITDHDVHQLWVHPRVDRYYTATDEIAHRLAERAIDAATIRVTGIPCDPLFGDLIDEPARQRMRRILNLTGAPSPTLLMNVHGCGLKGATAVNSLGGIISRVLNNGGPKTVLIVCGRNESVQKTLAASIKVPPHSIVKLYGFINNMHELMGIADLMVTKPGGLTTAECLARSLPMVLVSPIPGQEDRNAEMLLENGCAVLARTPDALAYKLETLLNQGGRLHHMREACQRTRKPDAAMEIASDIMQLARD